MCKPTLKRAAFNHFVHCSMVAVFCWRLLAVRLPSSQFDESDWTRGGAAVNTSNLSKQTHELQATAIACVFTPVPHSHCCHKVDAKPGAEVVIPWGGTVIIHWRDSCTRNSLVRRIVQSVSSHHDGLVGPVCSPPKCEGSSSSHHPEMRGRPRRFVLEPCVE